MNRKPDCLLAPPLGRSYSADQGESLVSSMIVRPLVIASFVVLASASTVWADTRGQAKEQVAFGIQVAQRGLWKEAIYRWERAAQLDPTYAAAFNNLAVAYEHEGQLSKARGAYEKALALQPDNSLIRQNYD